MIHSFKQAEKYLSQLPLKKLSYDERLAEIREILSLLGRPQDSMPAIHIAGTSGKGSTAYYAASLLYESGYKVGLSVSPHVNSIAERAQIDGRLLSEHDYCMYFNEFRTVLDSLNFEPSYIEFLDMFAFWLFAKLQMDYMVIEVGLGGRLDPTNVMTRSDKVCAITDIGLDHMEILGDTTAKIAAEKAGIIMQDNTVLMHRQSDEIESVIREIANSKQATLNIIDDDSVNIHLDHMPLYQRRNWTLAKYVVDKRLSIDDASVTVAETAIAISQSIQIPGRFEVINYSGIDIILDAAHNPQKIEALTATLNNNYPAKSIVYLVAFGHNKQSNLSTNMRLLSGTGTSLIATTFTSGVDSSHAAIDPGRIKKYASKYQYELVETTIDPYLAFQSAVTHAKRPGSIVVVTGSFYLIDGIRVLLRRGSE